MLKKILALILALSMLFCLCACGGSEKPTGELKEVEKSAAPAEEEETPAPEESDAPEEAEPQEEEAEKELELGVVNGGRYENSYLGIGCELDESWVYLEKEGLAQLIGMTADVFDDEEYAEQVRNADMFYDMYAMAEDGLITINILIQNLGPLYGAAMTEESYLESSLGSLESQMASAGITLNSYEQNKLNFAGQERTGLYSSCEIQGQNYYCQQFFIKSGNYMATITLASFVEDLTAQVSECFFAVD